MWWIETTGYHLAGLIWLIVIAVIFVIALVALSTAGAAASSARQTRQMLRDHEGHHSGPGTEATRMNDRGMTSSAMGVSGTRPGETHSSMTVPSALVAEDRGPKVIESEPPAADASFGDSMRILHERYARGEISREEHLRAREDMMAITR